MVTTTSTYQMVLRYKGFDLFTFPACSTFTEANDEANRLIETLVENGNLAHFTNDELSLVCETVTTTVATSREPMLRSVIPA